MAGCAHGVGRMTPAEKYFEAEREYERARAVYFDLRTPVHGPEQEAYYAASLKQGRAQVAWDGYTAWLRATRLLEGAPRDDAS